MSRDALIIAGIVLSVAGALFMVVRGRLLFARIGFVISAAQVCVGLAYFGWLPLFGGSLTPDTGFGALALYVGLLGVCIFGAIEEIWHRLDTQRGQGRGFPVITQRRQDETE